MALVSHPHNSQGVRSRATGLRLVNTGTVCVVIALVDHPVAAKTLASPRPGRWPRWALAMLLAATAVLYLSNLSASGYGNTFYAAASQAGVQSWSGWGLGRRVAWALVDVYR